MDDGYRQFLECKKVATLADPILKREPFNDSLFPFQKRVVEWALDRGRAAIFADCGLGKTLMQLEWARQINGRVIIFAPLAVAKQTEHEGVRFGYDVHYQRESRDDCKIVVTNYEMQEHFNPAHFNGVVLDESSILKNVDGKTKRTMCERWAAKYRLCCTATPSPNDFLELQSHSEFLGLLSGDEMQSKFFINDGNQTQKYRLKRHAEGKFWDWVCSWSVFIRKPSDIGFDDTGYDLPNLEIVEHVVRTECNMDGFLFHMPAATLSERGRARSITTADRVAKAAEIANSSKEQFLIWCGLNNESAALAAAIAGAVEVRGSDSISVKEGALIGFAEGRHRGLVTKPSIAGFGMNFQNCHNMIFVGLSDSYEQFYQAVRRCYRFGQTKDVTVHVIMSDIEGAVSKNIHRKEDQASEFYNQMRARAAASLAGKFLGQHKTTYQHKKVKHFAFK